MNANKPAFARAASQDTSSGTQRDGDQTIPPADGLTKREFAAIHIAAALAGSQWCQKDRVAINALETAEMLLERLDNAKRVLKTASRRVELVEHTPGIFGIVIDGMPIRIEAIVEAFDKGQLGRDL